MTDTKKLLIVEDDEHFANTLATEFRDRGYETETADSLSALRDLDTATVDYAVVDLRLRQDSGLDAIREIREHNQTASIVVLTGFGSIATAVQATKLGASSYLTKPADVDEIERALITGVDEDQEVPIPEEFQSLDRHEREYIEFVLAESGGNISHAAREADIDRKYFRKLMKKYEIEAD